MRFASSLAAVVVMVATCSAADKPPAVPDLPEAVSSFGACECGGFVYVYGGHAGKTHTYSTDTTLGKFRRLNVADPSKGWEELPGGTHLQGLALVAHGGKVIRVGGMEPRNKAGEPADSHSTAAVQAFDPKAGKWADLPSLPAGRSSHDAVVVKDTLVVVGGWAMKGKDASEWCDTALTLDLSDPKAEWKGVPQPFTRRALAAAAFDGKVYVFGGLTKEGKSDPLVNVLDPKTGKWTEAAAYPAGGMNGFSPAAAEAGGHLYLLPADGKAYKLVGDKWEEAGTLATPRWVHRAVPLDAHRMLVLGGAAKGGTRADGEVLPVK